MYKYISGFYPREPIHVYVSCTAMCAYFWLNCCCSFEKPTKQISSHRRWGLWISQFFYFSVLHNLFDGRFLSGGIILGSPLSCPDLFLYTITLPAVSRDAPATLSYTTLEMASRVLLLSKKPALSFHWVRDSFTGHSESVLYASDNVVHSNLSENFSIFCDNVLLCMYVCISWHYTCHLTIAPTLSLQCTRGLLMCLEQCTCCYSRWGWSFPPGCPCGRTPRMVSRNLANSKSLISVHLSWSQL